MFRADVTMSFANVIVSLAAVLVLTQAETVLAQSVLLLGRLAEYFANLHECSRRLKQRRSVRIRTQTARKTPIAAANGTLAVDNMPCAG